MEALQISIIATREPAGMAPMLQVRPEQALFLSGQRVAHLATVDEEGKPHVVPVCFAYVGGALYSAVDEKPKRADRATLRRVRNILARSDVCIIVDHYEEDWRRLAWLQIRGAASLVTEAAERSRALAALRERYPQYQSMDLESRPLIRITPVQVVAWNASSGPALRS
jgi:PPOX class probable F420-dependent enzyme